MTMPHLMNCPHRADGWCLECVAAQGNELIAATRSLSEEQKNAATLRLRNRQLEDALVKRQARLDYVTEERDTAQGRLALVRDVSGYPTFLVCGTCGGSDAPESDGNVKHARDCAFGGEPTLTALSKNTTKDTHDDQVEAPEALAPAEPAAVNVIGRNGVKDIADATAEDMKAMAAAQPDSRSALDVMVDRFLSWKLPQDFAPDCHISFKLPDPVLNPNPTWPVGTNLFTAEQARAMLQHILAVPALNGVGNDSVRLLQKALRKAHALLCGIDMTNHPQAWAARAEWYQEAEPLLELPSQ